MTTTNDLTAIEGIDINCSYEMICIDRLNTKVNALPAGDPTLRSDLNANIANTNTNTTNIATLTTISNNNRIIFNVKDYGAIGNDIVDDTTAINATISALNSNTDISSVLYFPKGTYRTSGIMKVLNKSNILILSEGSSIRHTTGVDCLHFDGCSNLKMSGNLYIFTQTTGIPICQGLVIRACSYCQFTGLHIGGDFTYGIHIYQDDGFRANTLSATIFGARNGIYLPAGSEYTNINNCCISQCGVGISCAGANFLINNCEINENKIGIYIQGQPAGPANTDHCGINNCSLNHNRACGIFLSNLQFSMSITGCQIWANNGADNLVEATNLVAKGYHYGIYIEKGCGVIITNNVIAHNDNIEIGYDGLTNSIINNNVFRSVSTCLFPIYEFYSAGNSYNNNQICNNIFYGSSSTPVGISSSLLRIYLNNIPNDGASNYIIKNNTGENKNNDVLMAVNSGDYYIGAGNNYVIDGLTITTSSSTDPSTQTANIYILPHATGTYFKLFFRRNNLTGFTWLRYKTNNTSLAPYIVGSNVVYSVSIRCFRIGPLNSVEFTPMSNSGLGEWCIVGA